MFIKLRYPNGSYGVTTQEPMNEDDAELLLAQLNYAQTVKELANLKEQLKDHVYDDYKVIIGYSKKTTHFACHTCKSKPIKYQLLTKSKDAKELWAHIHKAGHVPIFLEVIE